MAAAAKHNRNRRALPPSLPTHLDDLDAHLRLLHRLGEGLPRRGQALCGVGRRSVVGGWKSG